VNSESSHDFAVVGGGIVGLATALALVERGSVLVLEAEPVLAAHQTGHNSGVIHAGLYYRPGSLKARLCVEGRRAMVRFCEAEGLPFHLSGKLVVATRTEELPALDELERRGIANGLSGLRRLGASQIAELEPHVAGLAALEVRETGVVDYSRVAAAMARRLAAAGAEVRRAARLVGCRREGRGLVLETSAGSVHTKTLVNCAGLQCDRVARLCGVEPGLRIVPFRGSYVELIPERCHLVGRPIYPVPDPRFPFLGVHFTRGLDGRVEAGPTAALALGRHAYRALAVSPADAWDALSYAGTWRLLAHHWRTGAAEAWLAVSRPALVRALQRLVPAIRAEDLAPGGAGIRAQALAPDGRLVDDFHIVEAPGMVHVLNAPSPAATASLAIGRHVAERLARA
jgi:L-2-hydroxyglutarate oxidase